jgi:hypothetical protein
MSAVRALRLRCTRLQKLSLCKNNGGGREISHAPRQTKRRSSVFELDNITESPASPSMRIVLPSRFVAINSGIGVSVGQARICPSSFDPVA